MIGVTLKGLSADGAHVIVVADNGDEFRLEVTDALREAVRHPRVVRQDPAAPSTLSPREIQSRIRAGLSGAELAELTGEPLAAIQKFEAPVLAERSYIVQVAISTPIGSDSTAPRLGDLVADRLSSRGVDLEQVRWDSWREPDAAWHVAADYNIDGRTLRAEWSYDHVARVLHSRNEEAKWLTETELLDAPIPRRHLAAVRQGEDSRATGVRPTTSSPVLRDLNAPEASDRDSGLRPESEVGETEALLAELASKRGVREAIDMDDDEAEEGDDERFEGFGPAARSRAGQDQRGNQGASSHPAGRSKGAATPASEQSSASIADKKARKGRASVPSWDEIVFGAKTD